MDYQHIVVERGEIASITLNRPEKRNALNERMLLEIASALAALDGEKEVKAVVLRGAGKGFSAGADLAMMGEDAPLCEKRARTEAFPALFKALKNTGKITVSAVHGFALAGGFGLAMACDLCVCALDARLGMPEVKRDLMPMNIMAPLARVMNPRLLFEMVFSGESITGAEALAAGLVNRAVPEGELDEAALALARRVSAGSLDVIRLGKEAFYAIRDMEYEKSFLYLNNMLHMTMLAGNSGEKCGDFTGGRRS